MRHTGYFTRIYQLLWRKFKDIFQNSLCTFLQVIRRCPTFLDLPELIKYFLVLTWHFSGSFMNVLVTFSDRQWQRLFWAIGHFLDIYVTSLTFSLVRPRPGKDKTSIYEVKLTPKTGFRLKNNFLLIECQILDWGSLHGYSITFIMSSWIIQIGLFSFLSLRHLVYAWVPRGRLQPSLLCLNLRLPSLGNKPAMIISY